MKKLFTLFALFITAISLNAQNLLENWDGNGITGTDSEANKWGWACTVSTTWGTANGSNIRFMDLSSASSPNHLNSDNSVFTGREFLFRWDGGLWGSTYSLGVGDGSGTTVTPIALTACKSYTFSADYEWWNNGTQPTYSFSISDAQSGGTIIATKSATSGTTKNKLQPVSFTFTCPTTGSYYLQIKQTSGTASNNGSIIGVANISLAENTNESLEVNQTSLTFDKFLNKTKTFTVSGNALTSDVTLVAPTGIALSKTTVTVSEAQCGETITATYDETTNISAETISITAGALSKSITVNASNSNDATSSIVNPSFELGNMNGWTNPDGFVIQTNTSLPGKQGTYYSEKWKSSGSWTAKLSQTLTGLPNGFYKLTANTLNNPNTTGNAYIYANSVNSDPVLTTGDYSVIVEVTDGNLEIGYNVVAGGNYIAVDNFRLLYLGTEYLTISPSSFFFDKNNLSKNFNVNALGLTADITLTTPAGIALSGADVTGSGTSYTIALANANQSNDVTATWDGTIVVDGNISISSGAQSGAVTVKSDDPTCFTPLYNDRPNIITDSYCNDLSNFGGWGSKSVVTDYVYCGINSIKVTGKCGGSLDFPLTGKIEANKNYRVRAMISTNGTGEAKIGLSGVASANVTQPISTAANEWLSLDFTFTTGATLNNPNMYLNSCETQTATEMYIDNWEMYEMPTLNIAGNNTTNDSILFTTQNEQITVAVSATMFNNGFNVSSDNAAFTTNVTTLPNTGGSIVVTFTGTASADANLTIASVNPLSPAPMQRVIGGTSITVPMKATLTPTKVNQLAAGEVKSYIQGSDIVSEFATADNAKVSMTVYSANGVKIAERLENLNAGQHKMIIGKNLNNGVYLIKLTINGKSFTQKVVK